VLGPLVVGGFCLPREALDRLPGLGARDSKQLRPAERVRVYERLSSVGRRHSILIPPAEVDAAVRRGALNQLEAAAFARLIRRTRPVVAYVDACDPVAERFGRLVGGLAGGITSVEASHRADETIPVVGAASIVAKVRRDHAIARLHRLLGLEIGTGYPSDPRTIECVRNALAGGAPAAEWIRHSWWTAERLKPSPRVISLDRFVR
jgi:ribonuclease HII